MSAPVCTTLNAIRSHRPCADRWAKLLVHLGKTGPDDEPLPLTTILDSNGLDDALWALRAVAGEDRRIRLFAVSCARQVQHLMTDQRSLAALDVAERYANGLATDEELDVAWDAAWAASQDALRDVERATAWAAALAVGGAGEAGEAAADAAHAAGTVVWVASRTVAWSAARDAGLAAGATQAAGEAAQAAQAVGFRRVFGGDA